MRMHRLALLPGLLLLALAACQAAPPSFGAAQDSSAPAPPPSPTPPPPPAAAVTTAPAPRHAPPAAPPRAARHAPPDLAYLQAALDAALADFAGVSSYVVVDLRSGARIARNADVALAGMSLVKVPILINAYRALDGPPNVEQTKLISQTAALSSNFAANLLLREIAGRPDPYAGADIVTQSLRDLGLFNTFIAVPVEMEPRPDRLNSYLTPANQRTDVTTRPDPYRQTTTADVAALFEMLYACAEADAGPLRARYPDELTQAECAALLEVLQLNELARLLERGLPEGVRFAHKVGWIDDTHGDGGVVYAPGGDYAIVMALYAPGWLEWEKSAPLFETAARLAYAHFNDPGAYPPAVLAAPPAVTATVPPTPAPYPQALVFGTQGIGLTLRSRPGGEALAILPDGSVLSLPPADEVEQGGVRWRRVRTADGLEGWVGAAYLLTAANRP